MTDGSVGAYLQVFCRVTIGLVFLLSLVGKVRSRRNYRQFTASAAALAPGVPPSLSVPVVVAAEAAVVGLAVLPGTTGVALAIAAILLAAFTVAIVSVIVRKDNVRCNCFGSSTARLGWAHVVRNGALIAVAVAGLAAILNSPPAGPAPSLGATVVVVVMAGVVAVIVQFTDEITHLFEPID